MFVDFWGFLGILGIFGILGILGNFGNFMNFRKFLGILGKKNILFHSAATRFLDHEHKISCFMVLRMGSERDIHIGIAHLLIIIACIFSFKNIFVSSSV